MVVTSPGGVLLDVLAFRRRVLSSERSVRWVAVEAVDTRSRLAAVDDPVEFVAEAKGEAWSLLWATWQARRRLRALDASLVVSAGTRCAVPWFLAARSAGVPALWIETQNIHGPQGRAAVVCSHLADRVLVQQPDQLLAHRRSVLVGELY